MNSLSVGTQPTSVPDERSAIPVTDSPQTMPSVTHRRVQHPAPAVYPLLLLASTALAGAFCYLYLSKPVIIPPAPPASVAAAAVVASLPAAVVPPVGVAPTVGLVPGAAQLPGDRLPSRPEQVSPRRAIPSGTGGTAFEETNLRIQHIMTAETPGGDLSRIVLDVPVLYQTGTLAWTQGEVAEARELLVRLNDYQEQSRTLRDEGVRLLAAWNSLVERTIPTLTLRADSPALPGNQLAGEAQPQPATLDTSESIQLQSTGP